jgi:flagellar basal-body rod protein FlgG
MRAQQLTVDIIANNLANVNTAGFKRAQAQFRDLLYVVLRQPVSYDDVSSAGLEVGSGSEVVATTKVFAQGVHKPTENALDLAIVGEGFFELALPDGSRAFTRNGNFRLDSDRSVVTASGYLLQPPIQIPEDADQVAIGKDGTVTVKSAGSASFTTLGQIQLAKFVNPAGLQAVGNNLFVESANSGQPSQVTPGQQGVGTMEQGFLENSNVDVVTEMIDLITAQRAYEVNSRAIRTSDAMLQQVTSLVR